tara:strand:+ start:522 stop:776 length:255 start_codon:yes stop_codon:yes gene_type:complete
MDDWIEVKPKRKYDKRKSEEENKNISKFDQLLKRENFKIIYKDPVLKKEVKKLLKLHNNDIDKVQRILNNNRNICGSIWNKLKF